MSSKRVVIIGGLGLLGLQMVKHLESKGHSIIVFDVVNPQIALSKLEGLLAKYYQVNMLSKDELEGAINTLDSDSPIDAMINCAYPRNANYGKKFEEVKLQDFNENIQMHLGGYFLTTQVFAEYFKRQEIGNIILFSSIYGSIAPKFEVYKGTSMTCPVEYSLIKSSIEMLVKYVSKYYKGTQIKINTVSPGGIFDNQNPDFLKKYNDNCLSKGMLDSVDIMGTVEFLISDQSQYIKGQNFVIDDGFTL